MKKTVTLLRVTYANGMPMPMGVYTDFGLLAEHIGNLTEGYKLEGYEATNETMKQVALYSKTVNIKDMGEFTQMLRVERRQIEYHE